MLILVIAIEDNGMYIVETYCHSKFMKICSVFSFLLTEHIWLR